MKASMEHLQFLDDLRESGVTNMYGARPYLVAEFGLSKSDASAVLSEWMKTFSERKRTPTQEHELEILRSRGEL